MLKKIKYWFRSKSELIDRTIGAETLNKSKIIELDQTKVYVCKSDCNYRGMELLKASYEIIKSKIQWTAPYIIFTNAEIRELNKQEVDFLLNCKKINESEKTMERFVYNPKYVKMLLRMIKGKATINELTKEINVTAQHLRIVIDQFVREGIMIKNTSQRHHDIKLTEKGIAIAEKLGELTQLVNNYKPKEKASPEDPEVPMTTKTKESDEK